MMKKTTTINATAPATIKAEAAAVVYDEFLQHKVEVARTSMRAGRGRSNDEVDAKFSTRRTKLADQA